MSVVLIVQTCDNPVELGQDFMQDGGEIKISFAFASAVVATEFGLRLSWSTMFPLLTANLCACSELQIEKYAL